MKRISRKLSTDTEEYLKLHGIPYMKIDGTVNLIILRNNSTHHYCAIEFFEVDDEWYDKKKPFKIQRIWGNTIETIKGRINQYLDA